MKIGIILGTRPEIIKLSSIIRYCEKTGIPHFIIHTNQHYSKNMDKVFFNELELPAPRYNLNLGGLKHGNMIGRMIMDIGEVLEKEEPDVVLVQGDTNTVEAGAIITSKMPSKLGHVEAGLRSYDREMHEEFNRIVTDHLSDYLFCPTEKQKNILLGENIPEEFIHVTGNTIVDAVYECTEISKTKSVILENLKLQKDAYILTTCHRPANVDNKTSLETILHAFRKVSKKQNMPVIFPIHPRTANKIKEFKLDVDERIKLIDPVGFLDMLALMSESNLIITDSGGIQEEACILRKKCAIIRDNTERPETLDVGGAVLAGTKEAEQIVHNVEKLLERKVNWYNPFGDGKSGERICKIMDKNKSNCK